MIYYYYFFLCGIFIVVREGTTEKCFLLKNKTSPPSLLCDILPKVFCELSITESSSFLRISECAVSQLHEMSGESDNSFSLRYNYSSLTCSIVKQQT